MASTRIIIRPKQNATLEGIPQDVIFDDNQIETLVLAPGQIVDDILRQRGETREFLVIPRSRFL
jgi:hypothetical protein